MILSREIIGLTTGQGLSQKELGMETGLLLWRSTEMVKIASMPFVKEAVWVKPDEG